MQADNNCLDTTTSIGQMQLLRRQIANTLNVRACAAVNLAHSLVYL